MSNFVFNQNKSKKMNELVKLYMVRLTETSEVLKALLENNDWEKLENEIHKIKGTGSSFGFNDITELCVVIEEKIKNQDLNYAVDLIEKLIVLINKNIPKGST